MDWALATTPPNAEHIVAADLERAGYPFHFFRLSLTRAYRGRIVSSFKPAFPRYLFVPFDESWNVVRDVWSVLGIVTFGVEVGCIREYVVEKLVERCGGGNVLPPDAVPELYSRGTRVHIGGIGLMSGHDAVYECEVGDGKLRLLVDMLGRSVPIDVDQRDVSAVSDRPKRRRGRRRKRRAPDPMFV